jgi:hypothetical protein
VVEFHTWFVVLLTQEPPLHEQFGGGLLLQANAELAANTARTAVIERIFFIDRSPKIFG